VTIFELDQGKIISAGEDLQLSALWMLPFRFDGPGEKYVFRFSGLVAET